MAVAETWLRAEEAGTVTVTVGLLMHAQALEIRAESPSQPESKMGGNCTPCT